jgi:hypothetical protein
MYLAFRKKQVCGAAGFASAAFTAALTFASPAAADELAIKNNADVPVKVVVKNGAIEVGHADRIDKRSPGKVTLNPGISLAKITPSVEATPLGVSTRCSATKSGSQYEVKCDPVASTSAAPAGAGSATTPATRTLEIANDLKNPVTVMLDHVKDGKNFKDDHDIGVGGSATFTMPVDDGSRPTIFNVLRHLDMEVVSCGSQMRLQIPPSQQKMYVTPADGSLPPPDAIKRADSAPCVLSPTSRKEKADPKTSATPPVAPPTSGQKADGKTTKFAVENDLKDPITISVMTPFVETHSIGPKQSITFDNPVPHADGSGETITVVYISRSVNMRLFVCGNRLQYRIPPMPEVKFYATRVAGADWPPKAKPGQDGGGDGKDGLPPPPSCELTRSQNMEK